MDKILQPSWKLNKKSDNLQSEQISDELRRQLLRQTLEELDMSAMGLIRNEKDMEDQLDYLMGE